MKRDEAEKLLGGYATGTLTAQERRALADAALSDQQLFDALADEEALRELLAQPGARARLLDVVAKKLTPWERAVAWVMRPAPMGTLAGLTAVAIAVAVFIPQPERPQPKEMAAVRRTAAAEPGPAPEPKPADVAPPTETLADLRKLRAAQQPSSKSKDVARDAVEEREATAESREARLARGPVGAVIGGAIAPPVAQPAAAPPPPPAVRAEAPATPLARSSLDTAAELGRERNASASAAMADAPAQAKKAVAPAETKKEAAPPLRYRLERVVAAGKYATVAPASTLREGDSIRLIVEPAVEGWLHVQLREGTDTRTLLTTLVAPGKSYTVPTAGSLPAGAGDRKLLLLLTSQPPGVGQMQFRAPGTAGIRQGASPARQNEADQLKSARRDEAPIMIEIPLSYK